MPYINIEVSAHGTANYGINVATDLLSDDLVHKVLSDTLAAWDKRRVAVSSEEDEDEGDA